MRSLGIGKRVSFYCRGRISKKPANKGGLFEGYSEVVVSGMETDGCIADHMERGGWQKLGLPQSGILPADQRNFRWFA